MMFSILWQSSYIILNIYTYHLIKKNQYKKASLMIVAICIPFYLFSTKIIAMLLIQPLWVQPLKGKAPVVVVLGSNIEDSRLLQGMSIASKESIPIVLSGIRKDSIPIIQRFKDIHAVYETKSKNTYQNAKNGSMILRKMNIKKIYLVTSQPHMYRAKKVFEKFAFYVIPRISRPITNHITVMSFLPRLKYFMQNRDIIYEYFSLIYYKLTKRI